MGSLVRSLPTLFLTKLQTLNLTLGLGGILVRLTGRVACMWSNKLGETFENDYTCVGDVHTCQGSEWSIDG